MDPRYNYVKHFERMPYSGHQLAEYIRDHYQPISNNTVNQALREPEKAAIPVRAVVIKAVKAMEKEWRAQW